MKRGLSLSGGGVLGAAQIGLIYSAFETDSYFIPYERPANYWKYVCGTSIGAVNGLLIALNYSAREMLNVWCSIRKKDLMSINLNIFESIYKRDKMKKFIDNLISYKLKTSKITFSDLYNFYGVDLTCFATVVETGKALVFGKDYLDYDVSEALMMTTAYPLVFAPIKIQDKDTGKYYQIIDGGVLHNSPILPLISKDCDEIIVLSIGNLDETFKLKSYWTTLKRIFQFITIGNEFVSLSWAAYLAKDKIKIYRSECNGINPFDWNKIPLLVNIGIDSWKNGPVDPHQILLNFNTNGIDSDGVEEKILQGQNK